MICIPISSEKSVPPPLGNGFFVYVYNVTSPTAPWIVDSGLTLKMNMLKDTITVESVGGFIITGWTLEEGRLKVAVIGEKPRMGDKVAQVWFSERNHIPVRFIETSEQGSRIIRGDAQPVIKSGD